MNDMEQMQTVDHVAALFFELLQVAIGNRRQLSAVPTPAEWTAIYKLCFDHTLTGIGYCGMRLLPESQAPDARLIIHWAAQADVIRVKNEAMDQECQQLCDMLAAEGFEGRVLKGQSNCPNYPMVAVCPVAQGEDPTDELEPLGAYRTPGDIDILVRPADHQHCVRQVIDYCIRVAQANGRSMHHVFYHDAELCWEGHSEVEAHYRAIWLNAPWRNHRLQQWLKEEQQWLCEEVRVDGAVFNATSLRFNVIYQLLHVYKHLLEEGIGLRQMLDYYMVLRRWAEAGEGNNDEVMRLLHRFDCDRFAAACMYVLQQVFLMPDALLICRPDARFGEFLLQEILRAGNFGHADVRLVGHREYETLWHAFDKLRRNMKYTTFCPEEVWGEPLFSIYHWCWRKFRLWRF